jgi:hypothetical protein
MTDVSNLLKCSTSRAFSPFLHGFSYLYLLCLDWIHTGTTRFYEHLRNNDIIGSSINRLFNCLCNKEFKQVQCLMHDFITFKIVQL